MAVTPFMRARRERWGSALLSAALLLPIVLAIVILVHARRSERAQRDLAERALAHYATVVAWQLASRIDAEYHARIEMLVPHPPGGAAIEHVRRPAAGDTAECDCHDSVPTRVTFRYDPRSERLDLLSGQADAATRAAIERAVRRSRTDDAGEPHRVVFDDSGGVPRAISLLVPRNGSMQRMEGAAIEGAESDPAIYRSTVATILEHHPVLPPQLLAPPYTRSQLAVRVVDGNGFVVFTNDARFPAAGVARQSVPRYPHLEVEAAIAPAVAQSLIIGGLPPARVPAMLGLLAVATLLAGAALLQHRRARELARMRTQFIASVSHELRTPLTQISMFGETLMLGRERSEPERRQFASIIHREATRLSSLVDNVLRYTRGGTERFALRPEVRRLADEVEQAVAAFRPIADASSATIDLELDPRIHASIDPGAQRQIVLNLLDNAVKYGPAGQRITVSLARRGVHALLTVADEGPGIPEADRERIFDPFTRLEPAPRKVAGTGIGLAVVRELVTALGGTVTVGPRSPRGCAFTVSIPIVEVDDSPEPLEPPMSHGSANPGAATGRA